ncbi:hypothetical protein [Streptomyces guryensis]|uniref:Uncharacterized protein n=1 Tax=Streptomyces guryensis TaxID=2886947 RepID=A0A9Q3W0E4_9ACTN|nr:hypothetical protein [Streptomyces guryensis]MCD9880909.1 hypothetical protein [Streptomyces guryensis]
MRARPFDDVRPHRIGQWGPQRPRDLSGGCRMAVHQQVQDGFPGSGVGDVPPALPAPDVFGQPAQAQMRSPPMQVRLLDAAVLDQAPGRCARRRCAHWALHPAPLVLPAAPPALRLTALVPAAHSSVHTEHSTDLDILARLCGHSPQQTGELLDRLVTTRTLGAWHHNRETAEVFWQLPQPRTRVRPAVTSRRCQAPLP